MRCPKCGYISFDRQRSCGKCSHDLTAVDEELHGTAVKAESPFFLAAALGKKQPYADEPGPALQEEDEAIALDELEAEVPLTGEEELDFAGSPLNEEDLEDQPLPSLGLEQIDFADLVPPQEEEGEEEEGPELSLGSEQEEALPAPVQEEEESLAGIDLPTFEPDDTLNLYEQESPASGLEEAGEAPAEEEEKIIDLSSLMDFEQTPAKPAESEEHEDIFDLSLGDEPEELHLSLEEDDNASPSTEPPPKPASAVADIPDLGLTLENDDQ